MKLLARLSLFGYFFVTMIAPVQSPSHHQQKVLSPGRVPQHARVSASPPGQHGGTSYSDSQGTSRSQSTSGMQGFMPWWKSFVLLLVMIHNEVFIPLALRLDNIVCSFMIPLGDKVTSKLSAVIFSVFSVAIGVIQAVGGIFLWWVKTVLSVLRHLVPILDRACTFVECFVLGTAQSSYPIAHPVNDATRVTPQSAKSDKDKPRSSSSASSHPHRL